MSLSLVFGTMTGIKTQTKIPAVTLLTDNAMTFNSREFRDLLSRNEIQQWLISGYHSQANPLERVHRGIKTSKHMLQTIREFGILDSEIEVVINYTIHSSTGFSPGEKLAYTNFKPRHGIEEVDGMWKCNSR